MNLHGMVLFVMTFFPTLSKVAMAILWYVICNIGFPCCPCMKSSFALFLVCNIISLLTAISPFVPQWGEIISEWAFLFLYNCVFTRFYFYVFYNNKKSSKGLDHLDRGLFYIPLVPFWKSNLIELNWVFTRQKIDDFLKNPAFHQIRNSKVNDSFTNPCPSEEALSRAKQTTKNEDTSSESISSNCESLNGLKRRNANRDIIPLGPFWFLNARNY